MCVCVCVSMRFRGDLHVTLFFYESVLTLVECVCVRSTISFVVTHYVYFFVSFFLFLFCLVMCRFESAARALGLWEQISHFTPADLRVALCGMTGM